MSLITTFRPTNVRTLQSIYCEMEHVITLYTIPASYVTVALELPWRCYGDVIRHSFPRSIPFCIPDSSSFRISGFPTLPCKYSLCIVKMERKLWGVGKSILKEKGVEEVHSGRKRSGNRGDRLLGEDITREAVMWALRKLKVKATAGKDGITAEMMNREILEELWWELFSWCWISGMVPSVW